MDFFIYSQDSPKWYIDILIHIDSKKGQDKLQAFFSIFIYIMLKFHSIFNIFMQIGNRQARIKSMKLGSCTKH